MNYRHAYHAGNFADVVKHALLALIVEYLKHKPKAFRVFDIHAGCGVYRLDSVEAGKTGEWEEGIGKLMAAEGAPDSLAPYLDAVRAMNEDYENFTLYPGSPALVRHLLRPVDRLTLTELQVDDYNTLAAYFAGDIQTKVIHLDGWQAITAFVPPKEKRGLVLIDPPYEKSDDYETIIERVHLAFKKWPGGTYALWYPIKESNRNDLVFLKNELAGLGSESPLLCEMVVRDMRDTQGLAGTGMIIINPPYVLNKQARLVMNWMMPYLAQDNRAHVTVSTLV